MRHTVVDLVVIEFTVYRFGDLVRPLRVCVQDVGQGLFSFLLFVMQVSLYRQLYRPIHARLLLEF